MRRLFAAILCLLCVGCAPTLVIHTSTQIAEDHSCIRSVIIEGVPSPKLKKMRVNLRDYLDLPDPEPYVKYVVVPNRLALRGEFSSPGDIPSDVMKTTPHTDKIATNRVLFRSLDLQLMEVVEYEESISDIINRQEAHAGLEELSRILLDMVLPVLKERYSTRYDLAPFENYLRKELPRVTQTLYTAAWELRRARRGGIAQSSEKEEWLDRLLAEAHAIGVPLEKGRNPAIAKSNRKHVEAFIDEKLQTLCRPRTAQTPPLTWTEVSAKDSRDALLDAMQKSVRAKYGSIEEFSKSLGPLLPQVFGAFMIAKAMPSLAHAKMKYEAHLSMPGTIIQTNGIQDVDPQRTIRWALTEEELCLSGYHMWARSLIIRQEAVKALGLVDFPGTVRVVEELYRTLRLPSGDIDPTLRAVLKICIQERSLKSLRVLTQAKPDPAATPPLTEQTIEAAKQLLALLERYLPTPVTPTPATDSPELGLME